MKYFSILVLTMLLGLLPGGDKADVSAGDQILSGLQAAAMYCGPDGAAQASDPMQARLDQLIASVEEWNRITGGDASTYELYPGPLGTVFLGRKAGVPHGGGTELLFVAADGAALDIQNLLPSHFMYGADYLNPRDFQFSEDGGTLTFITPVKVGDAITGEESDWGDTLCTVDLIAGTVEFLELDKPPVS